jgi:ubiquinone/menaquinone biosynthesis C-methylase UbiE
VYRAAVDPAEAYDSYLVPAMFEPWSREVIQRAKVWSGDRVLDVACGTGIVACRIAATGAKVTGLDLTPAMLAQAKKRAESERVSVKWVEGSAERLPFDDASFDLVTCQQGLQFVPDRARALAEMRRVIAPGGRAVIACWTGLDHHPAYKLVHEISSRHFGDAGFAAPFSLGDEAYFRQLMGAARFHAVAVDTVTRTVRFPEPAAFATLSLTAAAAFFPGLANLEPEARAATIAAAAAECTPALTGYVEGEHLVVQKTSMLAVGRVPAG